MKKVLVLLFACMASTVMFAQQLPLHYTVATGLNYQAFNTKLNVLLEIDGEVMMTQDLEIGAFGQEGDCLGAKRPIYRANTNQYIYMLQLKGYKEEYLPETYYTFKVYDHATETELDLTYIGETYYYIGNNSYNSASAPINLPFVRNASGITLSVTPYTGEKDNYYLISSPVGDVLAESVENLLSNDYDLFYFDQLQDKEWINYQAGGEVSNDAGFASFDGKLMAGRGYLYANGGDGESEVVTLTFPGTEYTGTGTFPLVYEEGVQMAGWNLVGNPFNATATIDKDAFYVMNDEGSEVIESSGEIAPMQGVFVLATPEDQTVTFSTEEPGVKVSMLSLNLVNGDKVVDRASLNFGGSSLPKFQINSSSTKLYIPMAGEDYAVVSSEEMGEMPVNFKAEKSGSYSLVVSTEVSFNYLHLIDNKTGADVDLLATPSYSFEAQTTDYASRFKLVFATGSSDDTFAFYSNGSFVISNEGEAVVQVMDVTGRMLSSEAISGSASVNVAGAAGVYMIRLVNGESVKVQKVVVK